MAGAACAEAAEAVAVAAAKAAGMMKAAMANSVDMEAVSLVVAAAAAEAMAAATRRIVGEIVRMEMAGTRLLRVVATAMNVKPDGICGRAAHVTVVIVIAIARVARPLKVVLTTCGTCQPRRWLQAKGVRCPLLPLSWNVR